MKKIFFFVLVIFCIVLYVFNQKHKKPVVYNDLDIFRFEQSIFATNYDKIDNDILLWRKKLGSFFERFNHEILRTYSVHQNYKNELIQFTTHNDMREAYDSLIKKFPDVTFLEKDLGLAMSRYNQYSLDKKKLNVITYFSGFNYGVVTNDTILAIGLDYFLGKNSTFYKRLGTPEYMRKLNQKKFILPFCFEAIINNDFSHFDIGSDFLSQMIYKGKVMYILDLVFPHLSHEDKLRFDQKEFNWCVQNEENIWTFFIDKELLFSTDKKRFNSYINYSPFAKGMPKESPGKIAYFVGWRIVIDYMKQNPNVSVQELMKNINYKEILLKSKYKP